MSEYKNLVIPFNCINENTYVLEYAPIHSPRLDGTNMWMEYISFSTYIVVVFVVVVHTVRHAWIKRGV